MLTLGGVTGNTSEPTTPLTARVPEGNYFSQAYHEEPKPHISQSLRPFYSTGRNMSKNQSSSTPTVQRDQRGFVPMARAGPPLYTPTSPLSPTTPQSFSALNHQNARRPAGNMKLSGLPRYHPANFSSQDDSSAPPLSPRASRFITSQPRTGRGSDAQLKLQQYRRDQLAHAAKTSPSILSSFNSKPSPPRLTPLRSPVEPMTPLQLEGQGGYLFSGSSSSPGAEGVDGREMVERLVQRENERRDHPEARSGGSSPALSPAVSPAGGRG